MHSLLFIVGWTFVGLSQNAAFSALAKGIPATAMGLVGAAILMITKGENVPGLNKLPGIKPRPVVLDGPGNEDPTKP